MVENRIKSLRKSQNMTLINLRDKVNSYLKDENILINDKLLQITDSQLSQYENGKRSPRHKEIWEAISHILGTDVAYLMKLSDSSSRASLLEGLEKINRNIKYTEEELKDNPSSKNANENLIKLQNLRNQSLDALKLVDKGSSEIAQAHIKMLSDMDDIRNGKSSEEEKIKTDFKQDFIHAIERMYNSLSIDDISKWIEYGELLMDAQSWKKINGYEDETE